MITFLDGPADAVLQCRRVPIYLRVVIDCDGGVDALDLLEDSPEPGESVHAYRLRGKAGRYHLLVRGPKARENGGWWGSGEYEIIDPQPDEEIMRDNKRWREWATAQHSP